MLNQKIKEKFDEIDKISNEITKQNSVKTKDFDSLYEGNNTYNNSLNIQRKLFKKEQHVQNINKKNNLKTYYIDNNNKSNIEKNIEKLPNDLNKKIITSINQSKEKNPEKFVLQFFYEKPKNNKKNDQGNYNISCGQKNKKYMYTHTKNKNYRKNKYNYEERQNHSFNNINNQLLNYKSMVSRCHNATSKKNKNKSKENDDKINNLIKKLYDEGLQSKRKKEVIYKENLLKKEEEYKKYSFHPENKYKQKKEKSSKKKSISIKKLYDNLYSKQIEWKKKRIKENSQKKKNEEEIYMSLCTFKPDIMKEYIADDEKMIKRNLIDMNYYIIKRRNQIKYKKQDGFNLREYKKKNNNVDFSKDKEPLTERIYYRNVDGKNNSFLVTTNKHFNYSKFDFVKAVKNLHNEITNLNL